MGKKLKKTILNNYFNTLCVYLSKETDRFVWAGYEILKWKWNISCLTIYTQSLYLILLFWGVKIPSKLSRGETTLHYNMTWPFQN